jgi:hypothetical protein
MARRLDHTTRTPLSKRQIKEIADWVRKLLVSGSRSNFDVTEVLERLRDRVYFNWGKLKIVFQPMPDDNPAEVAINENGKTLFVDPEIWEDAKMGEPKSRYILAHELGHIVLHEHYVQPYSDQSATAYQEEKSTEWQAHRFAEFFLLGDSEVGCGDPLFCIAATCGVEMAVVRCRLDLKLSRTGAVCKSCGDISVSVGKNYLSCDFCGGTAGCS